MRVAYELNMSEREVLAMSVEEFERWGAFVVAINEKPAGTK